MLIKTFFIVGDKKITVMMKNLMKKSIIIIDINKCF
jgi:hypothetical protein